MRFPLTLGISAVLLATLALSASALAQNQGRYLSGGRSLTDRDFLLYFQFMELSKHDVDDEAIGNFASRNGCSKSDLDSLSVRITYGQLIIDNPSLAPGLEAVYGPGITPSVQERALFSKYSADIQRYQAGN
ncbi:MAG: hypothetical protein LBE49_06695 [Deltaproteobacteria bacterium]|jgi:hypothetical protein|nr:hypothetical protein [Deltaproteobacteria bacterium]